MTSWRHYRKCIEEVCKSMGNVRFKSLSFEKIFDKELDWFRKNPYSSKTRDKPFQKYYKARKYAKAKYKEELVALIRKINAKPPNKNQTRVILIDKRYQAD